MLLRCGELNGRRMLELQKDPGYILLQNKYAWCKSAAELYYCDTNNITEQPKCYCGKILNYNKTSIRKYGECCSVFCCRKSELIKNKIKQTCIKKYGVENPSQSKDIQIKREKTFILKFGVTSALKSEAVVKKIKQTCIKKYGVENPALKHYTREQIEKLNDSAFLQKQHHILQKPISTIAKELNVKPLAVSSRFRKFNIEVLRFKRSQGEKELFEFIKLFYNGNILTNDRILLYPYELDIYIPNLNIAFEYDGRHWHSSARQRLRDRWKTLKCKRLGITLYHIHDYLWINYNNRMKKIISNIIGKRNG